MSVRDIQAGPSLGIMLAICSLGQHAAEVAYIRVHVAVRDQAQEMQGTPIFRPLNATLPVPVSV